MSDLRQQSNGKSREEGAAAERARIVAWLRKQMQSDLADAIENGEHEG